MKYRTKTNILLAIGTTIVVGFLVAAFTLAVTDPIWSNRPKETARVEVAIVNVPKVLWYPNSTASCWIDNQLMPHVVDEDRGYLLITTVEVHMLYLEVQNNSGIVRNWTMLFSVPGLSTPGWQYEILFDWITGDSYVTVTMVPVELPL